MPIDMPIDLATVNWLYVAVLTGLVLIATVVGNLLSFKHRGIGAVLTAVIFAGLFVYWTYYPHGLPLPTTLTVQKAAAGRAKDTGRPHRSERRCKSAQPGHGQHAFRESCALGLRWMAVTGVTPVSSEYRFNRPRHYARVDVT